MAEPRPAALPPAERTIGQLVAESVHFYGEHFWNAITLGIAPAITLVVGANVSVWTGAVLTATVFGALISASYVYASVLVLAKQLSRRRLVVAWLWGWVAFAPVPFLAREYLLPGLIWIVVFALLVPVLVAEDVSVPAAFRRAWRLARADLVHQVGSLLTLGVVIILAQGVLAFVLRGFGNAAVSVGYFLASVVVSPLLFLGFAFLYLDQAARAE